ncbi:MAG: hypothetical protein AAF658_17610, partial [Myxococcota bacterium]
MSKEEISDELLYAWLDGEAGADAARVEAYVNSSPDATARIEEMTQSGDMLRSLVDEALGPVEPLAAMASIRAK